MSDSRIELVRRLSERAAVADGVAPFDEAVLLALETDGLPADPRRVEIDEHAAAWLTVETEPTDGDGWVEGEPSADLHLVVDPGTRGEGLGTARVELLLDGHAGTVRAWSHGDHPAARGLAERHGFARARALWVMRRPVEDLPALDSLRPSPGVRLRHLGSLGDPEADRDAVLRVNAAAFAEHPEQGSLDAEGFAVRAASDWFEPEGLLLAVDEDTDDLLGFHWTKLAEGAGGPGEIYVLGIDPSAQGRGLGTLLSLAGLHHLRDAGASEFLLYVEGDNDAAVRTYERLGFTHADADTHVQYVR